MADRWNDDDTAAVVAHWDATLSFVANAKAISAVIPHRSPASIRRKAQHLGMQTTFVQFPPGYIPKPKVRKPLPRRKKIVGRERSVSAMMFRGRNSDVSKAADIIRAVFGRKDAA